MTPPFMRPFVNKIAPYAMMPQVTKVVGLGSWAAVGGVFAFFLIQDPAFGFVADVVNPPPEESSEDN